VLLRYVLDGIVWDKLIGNLDIDIEYISCDSRQTQKKSLFIAVRGHNYNGHNFVKSAINNGAVAVIVDHIMELDSTITQIQVKDTQKIMARAAGNFYKYPSKELCIVGITGTNGKTTTSYLIKEVLEKNNIKTGLIGTICNYIGNLPIKAKNTTPNSIELQEILRTMINQNIEKCVMEVSSHALEIGRVEQCDFSVGIFTNLTEDHLDFHRTMEDYFKAKLKLFYKTLKVNIVNSDDYYGKIIIEKLKQETNVPIISYGIVTKADIRASDIELTKTGTKFTVSANNKHSKIYLPIPGLFNVYNSLAAIACGLALDLDLDKIKEALTMIRGVKGRFETINTSSGFSIVIDYAHTPDGLEKILMTARQFCTGRLIIIFGCGGDRDKIKRPIMGDIASNLADLCIVTSDNPRNEEPLSIIEDIINGIGNGQRGKCTVVEDRKQALREAILLAEKDDVIVIAGKGHETYQIIKDEIIPFDEIKILTGILKEENIQWN
jgi:UDP-N-acetylmuramoyl-L-alanyl-D-glutamate--2,6-diaminopimelate ligase